MSTLKCLGRGAFLQFNRWSHKLVFRFMYNVWWQWRAEIMQSGALHSLSLESLTFPIDWLCVLVCFSLFQGSMIPPNPVLGGCADRYWTPYRSIWMRRYISPWLNPNPNPSAGILNPSPPRTQKTAAVCLWDSTAPKVTYTGVLTILQSALWAVSGGDPPPTEPEHLPLWQRFSSALMFICLCSFSWPFVFSLIGKLVMFGVPFLCMTYVFLCPGIKGAEW